MKDEKGGRKERDLSVLGIKLFRNVSLLVHVAADNPKQVFEFF